MGGDGVGGGVGVGGEGTACSSGSGSGSGDAEFGSGHPVSILGNNSYTSYRRSKVWSASKNRLQLLCEQYTH